MRTLVTGGAGFIGSTLVDRLLAEGHGVDVIDDLSSGALSNLADVRSNPDHDYSFHRMDIRSDATTAVIAHQRPEVIFHLAAQADVRVSVEQPAFDAAVNIVGTINVLEGARAAGTRKVVFAASGGTLYGETDKLPVRESARQRPLSPYGVSKKAGMDYLLAYRELHGIECTSLALANVYGPRQDPHGEAGVVAIFAGQLLSGQESTIFGDGEQTRDFVYVDDVVDAFSRAATRGDGLVVNVGTGIETSVNQLYSVMSALAGSERAARRADARPGELRRSSLDPGRAAVQLGWKPWTSLEDGASQVLRWFRDHATRPGVGQGPPRSGGGRGWGPGRGGEAASD